MIGKVRRVLTEEGPGPLAYRAAQLLLRDPWGHTEWFDVFETPTEDDDGRPRPDARPADASHLAGLSGLGIAAVRERFAAGMRCACYRDDGVVHAMLWFQAGVSRWDENGVVVSFPGHGSIWAMDGYVHPGRRGESLHSRLFRGAKHDLHGEGYARVYSTVDARNAASQRSADKRSARRHGRVLLLRVGPWHLARRSSVRPRWVLKRGPVEVAVGRFTPEPPPAVPQAGSAPAVTATKGFRISDWEHMRPSEGRSGALRGGHEGLPHPGLSRPSGGPPGSG